MPNGSGAPKQRARCSAPHAPFSYSESRERLRRRCQRAYYYAAYGTQGGWNAPAGSNAWIAYRLKCLTPLAAAIGTAVHTAAQHIVTSLQRAEPMPSIEMLRAECAEMLNNLWVSSRDGRTAFLNHPRQSPMLEEVFYGPLPSRAALRTASERLTRLVTRLHSAEQVWSLVRAAHDGDVRLVDPFFSFPLLTSAAGERVRCYAAPDLLVRPHPAERFRIVDFKCGATDGVIDQILTYALAARDGLRLPCTDGFIGMVVALDPTDGSDGVMEFTITPGEIDGAADRVRENVARMRELVADPARNVSREKTDFRQTTNGRICQRCVYRGLCHPEQFPTEITLLPELACG